MIELVMWQNLVKDVCHLWELGGGTRYTNLVETPLSPARLPDTALVLLLDLSQPGRLWQTATSLLASTKEYTEAALRSPQAEQTGIAPRLAERAAARLGPDHPDSNMVKPFPLPLVILGGKYDIFQDFDPEKKKQICRALRYLAHLHAGSLQFYSARDPGLVKRARDLLSHHAFASPAGAGVAQASCSHFYGRCRK